METTEEANKLINVSFNFAKSIFSDITLEIYKKLKFTKDSIYSRSKILTIKRRPSIKTEKKTTI